MQVIKTVCIDNFRGTPIRSTALILTHERIGIAGFRSYYKKRESSINLQTFKAGLKITLPFLSYWKISCQCY